MAGRHFYRSDRVRSFSGLFVPVLSTQGKVAIRVQTDVQAEFSNSGKSSVSNITHISHQCWGRGSHTQLLNAATLFSPVIHLLL